MAWPLKLRAASLFITIGVVLTESVMGSVLLAVPLWILGVASAQTLLRIFSAITLVTVAIVALPPHLRPPRIARRTWLAR